MRKLYQYGLIHLSVGQAHDSIQGTKHMISQWEYQIWGSWTEAQHVLACKTNF